MMEIIALDFIDASPSIETWITLFWIACVLYFLFKLTLLAILGQLQKHQLFMEGILLLGSGILSIYCFMSSDIVKTHGKRLQSVSKAKAQLQSSGLTPEIATKYQKLLQQTWKHWNNAYLNALDDRKKQSGQRTFQAFHAKMKQSPPFAPNETWITWLRSRHLILENIPPINLSQERRRTLLRAFLHMETLFTESILSIRFRKGFYLNLHKHYFSYLISNNG